MKKTIKYLDNDGNYQYATVKDAGDLDKLKTKAKEDLVSAINELATNGIAAGNIDEINNKVDQIQQQVNQNADALNMSDQERQEMQQQIAQMQAEVQAKVAEMQKLAEEQNKKLQEASAELKKKADAIDVQKMQQDNAEALKNSAKALEDSLAATNEDLQKTADHLNEMEIQAGVVETSVKELQNGFESKVSSADFNEARTKLQEQETMVRQLNNELSTKASNNELDMVTQRVQKAESDIQQNAQGIKASVTKETMFKEMDDFAKYRENRLKYSRDFSNDWSLNGDDVIDDDHLFDTQHDVKSVSIRNGAYLTQTTDLDTDDMSKTFTLAMWVEKGKRPRAWYGSAELTNMKVKEDKGDYQRVYWTFVPTIVKQDIRITGDTSTQGNLIISEPKLEQSDRPSAWSTNTGDQYATTEKLAHDLKLTADKLESTITKQSEFADRQQQDESRITQTEHGVEVANQTIVAKTDGLRQEFDGKINATSKSLTTEYQSFTNRALGQMADGGANLILNSSFGSLKNSFDKWTNVNPKARIVTDDNGLKWVKLEQSGLTANSPIGLTSNLFRVKKGVVTIGLDIRTDNAQSIDNDNIVILESYNAEQKRVFTKDLGFGDFKITRETLFDHGSHRVTYKYNQTRDDTQYMAVHILLPKNGILYATNVLARTIANGEDSGEYAPNDADLREQVVQQRTRIEQNDQAIALKADQTKVTQDIDAAKSSLSGAISKVEQRAANLEVKADGITSSVSTLSKTVDGISVGGTNLLLNTKDFTGDWYQLGSASLQDLDGRKVIHAWADWSSYRTRQVIQLEQNTDYTISADIRSLDGNSSDNTVTIHGFLDGKDTQLGDLHTNGKLSSKQQRFSAVWHNTSAGQLTTFRLEGHGGWGSVHGSIYISHIKLEKGNKPTDWSPAPEDTDSNISALESRASKLEQTDSEIKASVTSVTNDLKNGKATLKEGIMSMTDDHLETKFSSINGKINGISVGGRNLLAGTRDFKNFGYLSKVAVTNGQEKFQAVTGTSPNATDYDIVSFNKLSLEKDTDYTASFWAKTSENVDIISYLFDSGSDGNYADGATVNHATTDYKRFVVHFHNGNNNATPNFIPVRIRKTGVTVWVYGCMLEKGNKPTDWSPAPEDTSAEIKSAKDAAIQVASDQINLHVNELSTSFDDKLNKRVNEVKTASEKFTSDGIEQTVKKITDVKNQVDGVNDRVNNLKVGTSNLLHHSDTFDGWNKGALTNISGKYLNGNVATLGGAGVNGGQITTNLDGPYDDQPVTWTVYAKADFAGDKLHTELWGGGGLTEQSLTTDWKLYKFSGQRNVNHPDFYLWGVTGNKGNIYVALPFAVVGNTIGTWTPNTEDVDSKFQYKEVTGAIDFNDLKAQQKIFYKDTQATNAPAGGNYWYYLDVEPGYDGRILQTAISDRDNITWVRTFAGNWSPWVKQADQRNVDDLNNQIDSLKTETTASVKNLGDRVTTEVNSITSRVDNLKVGSQNLIADGDASAYGATAWENTSLQTHQFYYNNTKLMFVIDTSAKTELTSGCPNWFPVKAGQQYTLYFNGFMSNNVSSYDVWLLGKQADAQGSWTDSYQIIAGERLDPSHNCIVTRTFTVPSSWNNYVAYIRFDNNGSTDGHSAVFFFNEVSLKEGNINTGYSPAPENTVNEIKKLNTKWDVANGQIQGKVTATDVNNILNGKGYATQSWAQSQFRMKSDSIDLEVKKITDPLKSQMVANFNMIGNGINLIINTGNFVTTEPWSWKENLSLGKHPFWKNGTENLLELTNNSPNEVYTGSNRFPVERNTKYILSFTGFHDANLSSYDVWFLGRKAGSNNDYDIVQPLIQGKKLSSSGTCSEQVGFVTGDVDEGYIRFDNNGVINTSYGTTLYLTNIKLEKGNFNTGWVPEDFISRINVSPEKIRLLSNKIEIDGNTYIHGTLNVPEVILEGKSGQIDLSGGQGIDIKSSTGDNHVKLTSNDVRIGGNEFFNLINNQASNYYYNGTKLGAIGRNSLTGDDQIKGLDMYFAPGQNNSGSNFEGGTYLALGYDDPNGDTIIPQIRLNFRDYATSHTTFKKGISLEDDVYFHQNNVHISTHSTWWIDSNPNGQDGIYFANYKWNDSWQPDFYQPTLMAGHGGDKHGDSGLSFLWNSLKLFGTLDLTGTRIRVNNAIVAPVFGWVSWTKWQNVKHLAIVDYNGFGGYAMSADGSPVLFGRDNTFSLMPNAGGTETGRNTGMSRSGDKDWKSPVS